MRDRNERPPKKRGLGYVTDATPDPPEITAARLRERGLIATALESQGLECPPLLKRAFELAELFQDNRCRIMAEAICAASVNGTFPTSVSVTEKLPKEHGASIFSFHSSEAIPLSCIEDEAAKFLATGQKAAIKSTLGDAFQACVDDPDQVLLVARHAINTLERIAVTGSESLAERLAARLYNPTNKIPKPTARYSIGRVPVCTPGNITTISGQAKQGKSSTMQAMIASTHAKDGADCFSFKSSNPSGHAVIHMDSEQSPFDHQQMLEQTERRTRLPLPPWLKSYCLTGMNADEIRQAIHDLTERHKKEFGGIHSVILDGAADAVHDVNDAAESNEFVAWLHALAIKHDCPIVCGIHLNPGSDFKTRGHLGSQLERKAETNLKVERDKSEAITLWAEKNRHAPILKTTGPRFAWNDEAGMHVTVESQADAKANLEFQELSDLFKLALSDRPSMSHSDLTVATVEAVKTTDKKGVSVVPRTAERKIARAVTLGILKKTFAGYYEIKG